MGYRHSYPRGEVKKKTIRGRRPIEVCVKGTRTRDAYCYLKKDMGAVGKGKHVVQKAMGREARKGKLTNLGYSTSDGAGYRRSALRRAVHSYGYTRVRGMLGVQAHVFRKRPLHPKGSKAARDVFQSDYAWLVKVYGKGE